MLMRLTRVTPSSSLPAPATATAAAATAAAAASHATFSMATHMQPVIARRSPAPWPKFSPLPGDLPLILLVDESEHDWEILDDENGECRPEVHARPSSSSVVVRAHPNRIVPIELLATLTANGDMDSFANRTVAPNTISTVTLAVNGVTHIVSNPSPTMKLISFLRYDLNLTGAKIGCGEGGCGSCTVVLRHQSSSGLIATFSTKACLQPIAALDGWAVTTTEGLGSAQRGLHPIQQQIVDKWATQCGYCTPGFVLSMYGLLVNNPTPTKQQIEDQFDGNICRCTGYRPIFAAMRGVVPGLDDDASAVNLDGDCVCGCSGGVGGSCDCGPTTPCDTTDKSKALAQCGKGDGATCSSASKSICHSAGIGCGVEKGAVCGSNKGTIDIEDIISRKFDPTNPRHQPDHFPLDLIEYNRRKEATQSKLNHASVRWTADSQAVWIDPAKLDDVFSILSYYVPKGEVVKLVGGNSSIGVEKYYPSSLQDTPSVFVNMAGLTELGNVRTVPNEGVYIGASITLTTLLSVLSSTIVSSPNQTGSWIALQRHLSVVANTGVRNVATWAGNFMLARTHPEFPSDLLTIFSGIGASVNIASAVGVSRSVAVDQFPSIVLGASDILFELFLPFTPENMFFETFKVRARHQNAHAIINAAFRITYAPASSSTAAAGEPRTVQDCHIVVGGLTGTGLFRATKTRDFIRGRVLNAATISGALNVLDAEAVPGVAPPLSTFYMASPAYRHSLVLTTCYKFLLAQLSATSGLVPARDASAFAWFHRPPSSGVEVFTPDASTAPVGAALPKLSAGDQASGEAKYVDDIALPANGLWAAFVYSGVAIGTIETIDASGALNLPGVSQFISAADIAALPGGVNDCGSFPGDEELFATKHVTATGQSIGLILADSRAHADLGAAAVIVHYATPTTTVVPLVTIADAMAAVPPSYFADNKYMTNPPPISCGDFATAYAAAPHQLTGTTDASGQVHFFMETQTCYAVPCEHDGLYLHSSSQGPTDIRGMIMRATGLPAHSVTVSTRRAGGGFGGKLSRSHPIACAAAIAARITHRPVKMQCSRTQDMDMWGKRAETKVEWQVGFTSAGKITAVNKTFYQNGGHTYEANFGSMSMCLLWGDNSYYIPNSTVAGVTCRTNTPSNTAMRAPGAFTSIWHAEYVIEAVAVALNMDPAAVREANFYTEGQLTPYQQPVTNITIGRVWDLLKTQAGYVQAQTDVAAFNAANKWRKQGVHMSAVKYGIMVPGNQIGLLLNVMQDDGSIVVSHTGCEIGQGINTKVAQTIAYELGIDLSLIRVGDNATNIVANGSQTGGSATSESACEAAIIACADLTQRLKATKAANPTFAWPQLIGAAAAALVNLTVSAQYNITPPAMPFTYYVWTAACSRVEIDVLTGEIQVLRADIVYDCGDAMNPAIDIGQIEGAYITGLGHYLTEEVVYDDQTGRLRTRGTWDYHPPSSQDIPLVLNVTLLSTAKNTAPYSVLGSKATAEPPMMLSASAFFAVRDAIAAVRTDQGKTGWFELTCPANTQAVQTACGITKEELTV